MVGWASKIKNFMRLMLVDFIDLRCSVSVPFLPSSLSPRDFAVPASSFLSELKGYMPAGTCIRRCFHCTEHLLHCCTVLTQILRKSVALLASFHVFFFKCLKMFENARFDSSVDAVKGE